MTKIYPLLLLAFLSVTVLYSCKDDTPIDTPPDNTEETKDTVTYTNTTKAIFDGNCAFSGCHNAGSPQGSVASYADAKGFAEWGRILGALKHETGFSPMPKNKAQLSDTLIANIEKWIDDGLHE